jgi:hypothetical protein
MGISNCELGLACGRDSLNRYGADFDELAIRNPQF